MGVGKAEGGGGIELFEDRFRESRVLGIKWGPQPEQRH